MNARRVATLHRELAELDRRRAELADAIADAVLEEEGAAPAREPRSTSAKILPPATEPSEIDRARARQRLRQAGEAPQ